MSETLDTTILRRAKALIPDKAHWWQGLVGDGKHHCAGTAILAAARSVGISDITDHYAVDVAWGRLAKAAGVTVVTDWNDAPERTYTEVMAAFDRAIEGAPE
jgi:hypothetical protein